jgi:predicted permease
MDTLRDDLRLALRRLAHQPGFAAVAILTLALGLGANTAVFTLVHTLMLRSLPVAHPEALYRLGDNGNCCVNSGLQTSYSLFSYRLYEHLRDSLPEFSELAAFQARTENLGVRRSGAALPQSMPGQFVTANYFTMFGVRPAAGRLLQPADDEPGAAPVAVMSARAWAQRYGRDPSVVGATFVVNGRPMTIVGVAAEGFFGDTVRPNPAAIWIPVGQEPAIQGAGSLVDRPGTDWLYAIGRLKPGARPEEVSARATTALRSWLSAQAFVDESDRADIAKQHIPVVPAGGGVALMRIEFSQSLAILFVTSALVLLVACANLANLLLARADRGQAAIRVALGAPVIRLMRQSLTEGVVLALAGGLGGLLVATAGTRALLALAFPGATSLPVDATPSGPVLLFALALAVVTGAVFTAGPAWAMARTRPLAALHGVGRDGQQRSFVPARTLVVVQVALSLVLLAGAGLLATSLGNLQRQPLGFEPAHRLVVHVDPPGLAGEPEAIASLFGRIRERLLRVPGIDAASYALYSPMEGNNWSSGIQISGKTADPEHPFSSSWNRVGPGYFETLGTRVVRGRAIDERDTAAAQHVAVVNEAFVRRFFESDDPIGHRLGIGDPRHSNDFEIVGVTEDVKYSGASRPVRPMIFLPAFQTVAYETAGMRTAQARSLLPGALVVRTVPGARDMDEAIRRALAAVDPDLTVIRLTTLARQVSDNFSMDRLMARLLSFYGLLALALASLGLYGVTAHAVARRAREIGVRMALGADGARIVRTMVSGPLAQTALGLVIGVPLALAAGRALRAQLYGVSSYDPIVLGASVAVLVASAALAAALPARRAAAVDPARVLRGE